MTNAEHQKIVEKKFNDSLENIMYELCVNKDVVPTEGASILGVPKNVFLAWRNKLRLGPLQRSADESIRSDKERLEQYKNELQNIDINRKFKYSDKRSLEGYKETLERELELQKARKTICNSDGIENLSLNMNIIVLEQMINHLDSYLSGELQRRIEIEIQQIDQMRDE